ncbi:MAG: DUF3341 domain-containing protein [Bryobacteraceae bacterium]
MSKNIAVFGIVRTRLQVEEAVGALRTAGFRAEDISVLLPENIGNKDLGTEKSTKSPEGAAAGGATGAFAGGVLGWLVGIGALAIPGIGPFLAAGPIMVALAGMGAGAVLGGATGALVGIGIPEYEVKRYEGLVRQGGLLISVHCDNSEWRDKAKLVLENHAAEDIASTAEATADFAKSDKPVHHVHE